MARRLLVALAAVIVLSTVIAAAATLSVNGGTIQVFSFEVDLSPQEPPPGRSGTGLGASKTATAFWIDASANGPGVTGEICVTNQGERPTEGLMVIDTVQFKGTGGGPFQDLGSGRMVNLDDAPVLAPSETHCYRYKVYFEPEADTLYRNTARVTIRNHSGHLGEDFGPTPRADFSFPEP